MDDLHLPVVRHEVVAWHGSEDSYAPLAAMRALVDWLPVARLQVIPGGDHFIFVTHGEAILQELLA